MFLNFFVFSVLKVSYLVSKVYIGQQQIRTTLKRKAIAETP